MSLKVKVCEAALAEIHSDMVLGIGTGSTVDCLIDLLPTIDHPKWVVSSSERTTQNLQRIGIEVRSLNEVGRLDLYLDGADQVLTNCIALKGKGGAHTIEKILATQANQFIGMVSEDKLVSQFSDSVPVEVLNVARSSVAREIVAIGGIPVYREGVKTDSGHDIIDVHQLNLTNPEAIETELSLIPGVVGVGIFAKRRFDKIYIAGDKINIIENDQ